MLIVTGTKRSGTSMWMQILIAAGFPPIGQAFPSNWEKSIKSANPNGFFESKFRQGVYHATNPDPETGQFLHPKNVRRHVVKIFIPGLVRTDYAYISAVVATMRDWREYCASLSRLYSLEEEFRARSPQAPPVSVAKMPPALEWWFENYDLVRNMVTRGFPFHLTTYDRLLRAPEEEIGKVLAWLKDGQLKPALEAVRPELRTQKDTVLDDSLVSDFAGFFDEFYAAVDKDRSLNAALIDKLNQTNKTLTARWEEVSQSKRTPAVAPT